MPYVSAKPLLYRWKSDEFGDEEIGEIMEFRLIYEGPLRAANSGGRRSDEKHLIRKSFHKQLAQLWDSHPALASFKTDNYEWTRYAPLDKGILTVDRETPELERVAKKFEKCGFNFVPLVSKDLCLVCGLDILFLRRDNPGDLILKGGDIDNRVKTLLDSLRIPDNCDEVKGALPDENEKPFFCLLESDSLITELKVTTDRLLRPLKQAEHENEVFLVMNIKVKLTAATLLNMQFI